MQAPRELPRPGVQGSGVVVSALVRDAYLDRYAEPDKGWTIATRRDGLFPYWHIDTGSLAAQLLSAVDAELGALFFGVLPSR